VAEQLTFAEYQRRAVLNDQLPDDDDNDRLVLPLLGLAGEVGALASEWKKRRRDQTGYRAFDEEVREELGDALWYMAILAERAGLELSDIAAINLSKSDDQFGAPETLVPQHFYDDDVAETQQLPRRLEVLFRRAEVQRAGQLVPGITAEVLGTGHTIGDPLDDNADVQDNYRYHDVMHMAHMAILGWSPVLRSILQPKRKRRGGRTDWVEDGGRAIAIEEGLTAAVFTEAQGHSYFATSTRIPGSLIKSCMRMTAHLEVSDRTAGEWQRAILTGYAAYNFLAEHREAIVVADMHERTLTCRPLDDATPGG
jgi:NTP pyrophosphatase (non-canonical NTP hydrolase)